jgi:hypothetical protein
MEEGQDERRKRLRAMATEAAAVGQNGKRVFPSWSRMISEFYSIDEYTISPLL